MQEYLRLGRIEEKIDKLTGIASPNIIIEQAWELLGTAPLTKE